MSDGLTLEKLKIDERLRNVETHMALSNQSLGVISELLKSLDARVAIQNGRVTKLENWKTYILGGIGAVGGVFAFIVTVLNWLK